MEVGSISAGIQEPRYSKSRACTIERLHSLEVWGRGTEISLHLEIP